MVIGEFITDNPVFHSPDCECINRIKPSNMIYFTNQKEARLCGYSHCSVCSRILGIYQESLKEISKYSQENGLITEYYDDSVLVDNEKSSWKIVFDSTLHGLTLYHANTEAHVKYDHGRQVHNYHLQNYKSGRTILDMLKYIVEHDKWKEEHADECKTIKATKTVKPTESSKKPNRKHFAKKKTGKYIKRK